MFNYVQDASASPYYMGLERPEKEEYNFLFKFIEKAHTTNATYSIVVEGFQKLLQNLVNSGTSKKNVSKHKKESRSATKVQGHATKSRSKKTIDTQKMEDGNASALIQIEDDDTIVTFIKRNNTKQSHTSKSRSQQNKKNLTDDAKESTQVLIEDDDKISSFTKRKRQVKSKKETQNMTPVKIKQEKL